MPFDGAGNYSRTNGQFSGSSVWANDQAAGVAITTGHHDTHDQDIANALSNCVCKDGQTTLTGNLAMNSHKVIGLTNGSARTDSISIGQLQDGGVIWGGNATGTTNTYAISLTPPITGYVSGQRFAFVANSTNSGASTLNINGVGPQHIIQLVAGAGHDLLGGEIVNGQVCEVAFNGSSWVLLSPQFGLAPWTPTITPSGAMTYTSSSVIYGGYQIIGQNVHVGAQVTGTAGGTITSASTITLSLPVTAANVNMHIFASFGATAANQIISSAEIPGSTANAVVWGGGTTFSAGTLIIEIRGMYQWI